MFRRQVGEQAGFAGGEGNQGITRCLAPHPLPSWMLISIFLLLLIAHEPFLQANVDVLMCPDASIERRAGKPFRRAAATMTRTTTSSTKVASDKAPEPRPERRARRESRPLQFRCSSR